MEISLGRRWLWRPGETQTRICVPALTYFSSQVLIKGFIPKRRGKEVMQCHKLLNSVQWKIRDNNWALSSKKGFVFFFPQRQEGEKKNPRGKDEKAYRMSIYNSHLCKDTKWSWKQVWKIMYSVPRGDSTSVSEACTHSACKNLGRWLTHCHKLDCTCP